MLYHQLIKLDSIDLNYNNEKYNDIKSDFSQFHASPSQLSMIYELSSDLAKRLGIEDVVMRQIYIKSFVEWQKINRKFHFENEQNISQFKLVRSSKINEILIDGIMDLLIDPTPDLRKSIMEKVEETFTIYINKYAGRSV